MIKYKLVYNPASVYSYQLYRKIWCFWILCCRSVIKQDIDDYIRLAGQPKIEYLNEKGEVIKNGN